MAGFEGEPVAMALRAGGVMIHRYTSKYHEPRGMFLRHRALHRLRHDCRW